LTPIAKMVERMLSEGAPIAEVLLAAVCALENITPVTRDVTLLSREKNRARQARHRKKLKKQKLIAEAKANDVAPRNADVTRDTVTQDKSALLTSLPFTSGEPVKESKREVVARARGTRLAAGAALTQEFIDAALGASAPRDAIPKIWSEFVDYWSDIPGQRGCKISWLGTWRNNVKRVLGNGQWNVQKHGRQTVHDAARNLAARVQALDEPAPGLCDTAGGSPFRLISQG